MTEPPAWPPRADRPPPDVWPPHQPSAPPVSGPRLGDAPTAETPTIDAPTAETPIIATPAFPAPPFPTPAFPAPDFPAPGFPAPGFDPPPVEAPPTEMPTAVAPTAETAFAETAFAETATAETPVIVAGADDTPTATVPAVREPVLVGSIVEDDDRTWHTPVPASQHFHPAHEANWPTEAGQQQWLPDIHHDEQWHPQHEQPPLEKHPDEQEEPQPRGRRTAMWLSLALVFTLLLCGGGAVSAYLLLRNADGGGGAPDPATAVTRFLSAVYSEQDPGAANDLLCSESRDTKKMTAKIDEVRGYARTYDGPQFRWAEPAVSAQEQKRATVAVDLTMTTRDEKTAQQRLTFTVVRKTGWWVCEVTG